MITELTPDQRTEVENLPDWWFVNQWLTLGVSKAYPLPGTKNALQSMFPFRHGEYLVATNCACMVWCKVDAGRSPFSEEFLQRDAPQVRQMKSAVAYLMQTLMTMKWSELGVSEEEAIGAGFDRDFIKWLRDMPRVKTTWGKVKCLTNDQDPQISDAVFFKWGWSGGGVIIPMV